MHMLSLISNLTSFGAAGLMGAMWLTERRLNRNRERQLDEAHQRIARDEHKLSCLIDVVNKNTAAIVRLARFHIEQSDLLKHLLEEIHHGRAA